MRRNHNYNRTITTDKNNNQIAHPNDGQWAYSFFTSLKWSTIYVVIMNERNRWIIYKL